MTPTPNDWTVVESKPLPDAGGWDVVESKPLKAATPPVSLQPPAYPKAPVPSALQPASVKDRGTELASTLLSRGEVSPSRMAKVLEETNPTEPAVQTETLKQMKSASQGWADIIPEAKTPGEAVTHSIAKFALGAISPESLATVLATGGMGETFQAALNLPRVVSALKAYGPAAVKFADVASKAALPAAFSGYNVYQGGKAAVGAATGEKTPEQRIELGVEAVGDLILAGLGARGTRGAVKGALAEYPTTAETTPVVPRRMTQAAQEMSEQASPGVPAQTVAKPSITPAEAAKTASELSEQGNRLAASVWQDLAKSSERVPINWDGNPAYIEFTGPMGPKGRLSAQVVAEDGTVLIKPRPAASLKALSKDRATTRAGATPEGEAPAPPAIVQQLDEKYSDTVAKRAEAQSERDKAANEGKRDIYAEAEVKAADEDLSAIQKQRAKLGAEGTQLPQAERPAPAPEVAAPPVVAGQPAAPVAFSTGQKWTNKVGAYDITGVDNGVVSYQFTNHAGEVKSAKMPEKAFQAAMKNGTLNNDWSVVESKPLPAAETPAPSQESKPTVDIPEETETPAPMAEPVAPSAQNVAPEATPATQNVTPSPTTGQVPILDTLAAIPHWEEGVPVNLEPLREAAPDKAAFDAELVKAADAGKVFLTTPDHVVKGQEGRYVHDPKTGKYYVAAQQRPAAQTSEPVAQPAAPVKVKDTSVRDFPVTATRDGDTVTVVVRLAGKKIHTVTITRDEWLKSKDEAPGNPLYGQAQLARRKLEADGASFTEDGAEQAERIANAIRNATAKALDSPAAPKKLTPASAIAHRKDFFTPGNIVPSYDGMDKVLQYEDLPDGAWRVQVQAVDKDGVPLPNERPRWHSTEPKKGEKVVSRAPTAATPANALEQQVESIEGKGAEGLANSVYAKLKAGESLGNVTEFNKLAEQHLGGSRTSGAWTPKDAFDAMEAGVNKYLVDRGKDLLAMDAKEGLKELRELMGRITSQGTRTEEQIKNQQFSTPPTESYIATKVANLRPTDVVLEPSAGNGGLAVWPKAIGAQVHVNEISERRQNMLKISGFPESTAVDGEMINSLLPESIKPTVILMNPPFSASTLKAHEAKNRNQYGFNHVTSALQRLQDGGRLVAILGGGQANEPNGGASLLGGKSGAWFDQIGRKYNVRANVRIHGKEYAKYGTAFATRIIVIDKDGPTKSFGNVIKGNVNSLEEAYDLLRGVEESRPTNAEVPVGASSAIGAGESEPGTGVAPVENVGTASDRGEPRPEQGARGQTELAPQPGGDVRVPGANEPQSGAERNPVHQPDVQPAVNPAGEPVESAGSRTPDVHGERPVPVLEGPQADSLVETPVDEQPAEIDSVDTLAVDHVDGVTLSKEETASPYIAYQPSIKGPKHPGTVVETKTMATVPLPTITYRPSLPASVVESGKLSAVQLEGIAIAGQQNDIILPGGFRASALIGDGTGLGKGRQAAGILWDNFRQGRKRLVWVSEKWDLMQDAARDFDGLGAKDLLQGVVRDKDGKYAFGSGSGIKAFQKFPAGSPIKHEGVLFTTYALIRSEDKKGNTRVGQLEQWLRGADEGDGGYILFDESHNLKNAVSAQGTQPSQIGKAVKELMARNPKLRSASMSATAATDVINLGYLDRLGLWGPGTAFPNGFQEFAGQIAGGGMSAMEMVARELKAQGKYVSRTLSFDGVTYSEAEHKLSDDQKALYRTAGKAWKSVVQRAEATIKDTTNGGGLARGRFLSMFYGAQQRFFNLLITTLKVPTAIELAQKGLADGKSVVITLVNTNEAAQNREKNKARDVDSDEIPDYDFGPKEMLIDLVKEHYPVQQFKDDVDSEGRPIKVPLYVKDADGRDIPVTNPEAIRERDELVAELDRELNMPANPLDILVDSLGGDKKVAELTGRKERYDQVSGKFIPRGDPKIARDQINLHEMRNFQSGKKRIAVLSSAAGTGISLHAGNDVLNKQPRLHITLQVGWSADKQMQMFGRTHRTNQAHAPEYVMLVSDLGGEKRFVSTIARRLGSLGALTKGQKNATSGTDLMEKVNFETEQGRQATNSFYNALLADNQVPGSDLTGMQILTDLSVLKHDPQSGRMTVPPADRTNVTKLLNRLLALDPDVQNSVYNYFYDIFQAAIQDAIDRGTLDTGVKTLPGDDFDVKEPKVIATDAKTGAETLYYPVDAKVRTNRISPKDLEKRFREHRQDNPRIFTNDKGQLAMIIDAKPIVHADGKTVDASYVAHPGNGKWKKIPNYQLRSGTEVGEWAKEQLEKAQREVRAAESNLKYYQDNVSRYANDPWMARSMETARTSLETAQNHLAESEPIAKDPKAWYTEEWGKQYQQAPEHATVEHHLIGGAVLRWWNPIKESASGLNIYTAADSKSGNRVVGVDIPADGIKQLLERITGNASTVNGHQLEADVLKNGLTYTLEKGIQVLRGRIGRNTVVQLIPPDQGVANNLKRMGVLYERGVVPIYYAPTGKVNGRYGYEVLDDVLKEYPVKPDESSSTASSGERGSITLSALTLGADEFIRQDVRPALINAAKTLLKVKDGMLKAVAPASRGPAARATELSMRDRMAYKQRQYDIAKESMGPAYKAFAKTAAKAKGGDDAARDAFFDFYDRMEKGEPQRTPELTDIGKVFRSLLDQRTEEIQDLGTGALENAIINYMPHLYKDPDAAAPILEQLAKEYYGRRPMEGSKAFLKQRTIDFLSRAYNEHNLEPLSWNPVDMVIQRIVLMDKYIMAHRVFNDLKDQDLMKFVRSGESAPDGYRKIEDKIATVFGPRQGGVKFPNDERAKVWDPAPKSQGGQQYKWLEPEDVEVLGRRVIGEYWAPEQVARVINNHLGPGLRNNEFVGPAYNALLGTANFMNQLTLGFSAFHAGFTSFEANTSQLALSIYQLMRGEYKKAGLSFAEWAPQASFVTNAYRGRHGLAAWKNPGSQGVEVERLITQLQKGGFRATQDSIYRTHIVDKIKEAWAAGNPWGAAARLPMGAVEASAQLIMNKLVPWQKTGVAMKLMESEIDRLGPDATEKQLREAAAKITDSVDNRLGQLAYDNLFWNKTFKDIAQISIRSVGWNLGTYRELGGGAFDIGKGAVNALRRKGFEPSYRMAYIFALAIQTALVGAIATYLFTGRAPHELKDYYFPPDGTVDANGHEGRWNVWGYAKDVVSTYKHPLTTISHKLNPMWGIFAEMATNKDFWGGEIFNEDDPFIKQALAHTAKSLTPYAVQGAMKEYERGGSATRLVLPFVGMTPASRTVTDTPTTALMGKYLAEEQKQGARPKGDVEASHVRGQITQAVRKNDMDRFLDLSEKAIRDGRLTEKDIKKAVERATTVPLEEDFKRLTSIDQAINVFSAADTAERESLRPLLEKKFVSVMKNKAPIEQYRVLRRMQSKGLLKEFGLPDKLPTEKEFVGAP